MKFGCVFILLAIVSCSFNARQETLLNKATISYINAFNEKEIMNHVASTHPNCVSFYKDQGDSIFKAKFNLKSDEKISETIMTISKKILLESYNYDSMIRQIVKDIVTIYKREEDGEFYLPEASGK